MVDNDAVIRDWKELNPILFYEPFTNIKEKYYRIQSP